MKFVCEKAMTSFLYRYRCFSHRRLLVGYRMRMYFNKKKNVFIAVKISLRRCDCFDLEVYDSCGVIVTNMSTKCFYEYVSFKAQFWSQSYCSTKYVFHFFKEIKKKLAHLSFMARETVSLCGLIVLILYN